MEVWVHLGYLAMHHSHVRTRAQPTLSPDDDEFGFFWEFRVEVRLWLAMLFNQCICRLLIVCVFLVSGGFIFKPNWGSAPDPTDGLPTPRHPVPFLPLLPYLTAHATASDHSSEKLVLETSFKKWLHQWTALTVCFFSSWLNLKHQGSFDLNRLI